MIWGWLHSKLYPPPRWRIQELANGKANLQEREFDVGRDATGSYYYKTVGVFDHPADALVEMKRQEKAERDRRVVSETYWS